MSVVVCYACVHSNAVSDNVVYVLFLREHSSMTCLSLVLPTVCSSVVYGSRVIICCLV